MTTLAAPGVPFPLTPSSGEAWTVDEPAGTITVTADPHSDIFIDPGAGSTLNAESMLNAATLLGVRPAGDFQLSARVSVDFASTFDAGVLRPRHRVPRVLRRDDVADDPLLHDRRPVRPCLDRLRGPVADRGRLRRHLRRHPVHPRTPGRLARRLVTRSRRAAALDATDKDVSIGGASLAAAAIELGLVDELRMFRNPVVVGGGKPFLPPVTEDVRLDLVETRTFGSRVIYERYGRARDESTDTAVRG
jgi:RibD C-terminal domain